jgi:5-methylcytosine-specific restriction endonuclease McrA
MTYLEKAELDAMHREAVMLRANASLFTDEGKKQWLGECEKCRKLRWLQVSHIEPKGRVPHLRWDVENAVALCVGCHLFWWHKHPREAEEWITAHLGAERRAKLAMRARVRGGRPDFMTTKLYLASVRIRARESNRSQEA